MVKHRQAKADYYRPMSGCRYLKKVKTSRGWTGPRSINTNLDWALTQLKST